MEEHGVVMQKKEHIAVIRATRTGGCDSCASKKSCHSAGAADNEVLIEALDPIGVKVGDRVAFSVSAGAVLKAGFLLYMLPVAFFIAGLVLGQTVLAGALPAYNADLVTGMTGLVFLVAAFLGLKVYGFLTEKTGALRPRVLRVE